MNPATLTATLLFFFLVGTSFAQADPTRGRILDRNGTVLAETVGGQRAYPHEKQAAQLTGYVSKGGKRNGVFGLEKSHDQTLDEGNDITLTVDMRIQRIANEVFPEGKKGAVVVIEPETGAILALASFPTFDPNDFIPIISREKFEKYSQDPRFPLWNRAIHPFTPGSTYIVPVALAAGMSGIKDTPILCDGGVQYGERFFKCWISGHPEKRHGELDLSAAIKASCNACFYQIANKAGFDSIEKTTRLLGLTEPTGCGLPDERTGMIGTPARLKELGGVWSDASVALIGVGQGLTQATPLQLASMTATVANGGKHFQPHIVLQDQPILKTDLTKSGIPADRIELIRKAMQSIVNEEGGSGPNARSGTIEIAGKTGTAQTGKPNSPTNGWFIGFAPFENPALAVCVFIENAGGNRDAAPAAREVLTRSLPLL